MKESLKKEVNPKAVAFQRQDVNLLPADFEDNRPGFLMQYKLKALTMSVVSDQNDVIQKYPEAMNDENAKALGNLYSEDYNKDDDQFTDEELIEIKAGVFMLTDLSPQGMSSNCIGWAQGTDSIEPVGSIFTWESSDHLDYTPTSTDAGDAKIILWGTKEDEDNENKWKVLHASVLLTHSKIADRSKNFGGFEPISTQDSSDAGIPDPSWTSAGGFGLGVIVHPRNWYEGGEFGTALKGMK